jgi:hypothetical protein
MAAWITSGTLALETVAVGRRVEFARHKALTGKGMWRNYLTANFWRWQSGRLFLDCPLADNGIEIVEEFALVSGQAEFTRSVSEDS